MPQENGVRKGGLFEAQSPRSGRRPLRRSSRLRVWLLILAVSFIALGFFRGTHKGRTSLRDASSKTSSLFKGSIWPWKASQDDITYAPRRQPLKHLLVAAPQASSPDLCKQLLTSATLRYPPPHFLTWNGTFNDPNMDDGGADLARVKETLAYLDKAGGNDNEELVLLLRGHNIWFQLPPDVLVSRYYAIIAAADSRLEQSYSSKTMQQVHERELEPLLANRIVFGAAKRCLPNQLHTMACYATPDSPLPADLYGANTDTATGFTEHYSYRPRYLDSGYIIGPVSSMRRLFRRTVLMIEGPEKVWSGPDAHSGQGVVDFMDDGTHSSAYLYHGDAQSIFAKIFGRQSYIREVVRRKFDDSAGKAGDEARGTTVEGTVIENKLNPPEPYEKFGQDEMWIPHERNVAHEPQLDVWNAGARQLLDRYDFGVTLDYGAELGHVRLDGERDAMWLVHDGASLEQQVGKERSRLDCPLHLPPDNKTASAAFPDDVAAAFHPEDSARRPPTDQDPDTLSTPNPWLSTPLYTHLCLSTPDSLTIPAMIQHNRLEPPDAEAWHNLAWLYSAGKPLLERPQHGEYGTVDSGGDGAPDDRQGPRFGGAWVGKSGSRSWGQLCSAEVLREGEVFGRHEERA